VNAEQIATSSQIGTREHGTSNVNQYSLEKRIQGLQSGQSLPSSIKSCFENRFGYDFINLRIHTDAVTASTAKDLNALAFTFGRDIAFAWGKFSTGTTEGRQLLAHELVQVVQQRSNLILRQAIPLELQQSVNVTALTEEQL
jgi:hypothetical protein